jgi:hypothetical protein
MSDILNLSQTSILDKGYSMTGSKMIRLERTLLLVWFVINLGIGALTVHEYGMSIDEPNNYRYAADTLAAYPSFFGLLYEPKYDSSYDGHGPAFVTLAAIPIGIIQKLFPAVFAPDLWHFSYFITFLLTGLCLYWLARRWFNAWTAWGLLLLFTSQPVLLGHAFINPKDIPFMFFLTLSVLWGFRMADSLESEEPSVSLERPVENVATRFHEADPHRRRKFLFYLTLALAVALALILFSSQVHLLIARVVSFFYTAQPDSWAGRIFGSVANTASGVSAADYSLKALRLFDRLERAILVSGVLFFLGYFALLINNLTLPAFLRNVWAQRYRLRASVNEWGKSLHSSMRRPLLKQGFAELFRALGNPRLILAGAALGLAAGVRAIGPVAGVIVLLYLFAKARSRAWPTAIAYFLVVGIVTFIAWPRLWDAPIPRYLEGLGLISNFPHFPGQVLFNGRLYGPRDLPRSYLPTLLTLQFTEPLILGVYIGLGVLIWRLLRDRLPTGLLIYIGLGFAFPLFGLMLLRSPLYHNFRQTLFLIPAMAMLAALPLELVFKRVTQNWIRGVLIAALAFPGIYSTVKLYPYEYVYYNSLVGGPAGALHRYELDYWRISLREMALKMNEVARPGAVIVITRSAGLFARYARPDLIMDKPINSILDLSSGYDYVVQVTRGKGGDIYPEVEELIVIERDGAVLATAKDVKDVSKK